MCECVMRPRTFDSKALRAVASSIDIRDRVTNCAVNCIIDNDNLNVKKHDRKLLIVTFSREHLCFMKTGNHNGTLAGFEGHTDFYSNFSQ